MITNGLLLKIEDENGNRLPHPLATGILNEVHTKMINYSILFSGPTQYRKSCSAVGFSKELDPDFDLNKDMFIIDTGAMLKGLKDNAITHRGKVILLDELGIAMSNKNWYTFMSKAMNFVMQTHGWRGRIVIATVPYTDLVNKDTLKMFNMHIEIFDKNEREKYALARVKILTYNEKLQKVYEKFPRGLFADGSVRIMSQTRFHFPPQHLMDDYFKLSIPAKEALHFDLVDQHNKLETARIKDNFNPERYIEEMKKDPQKFISNTYGRKFWSTEKIENEFNIGDTRARRIKIMATQKLSLE
jgi:hypothetical protein